MKRGAFAVVLTGALSGCSGVQSVFNAQGEASTYLKSLIFSIVGVCTLVWLLVVLMMFAALIRRRSAEGAHDGDAEKRRITIAISAALAATVVIITGFTIASFLTTRSIGDGEQADVTIEVHAHQWWWQFIYLNTDGSQGFVTANELHIPVGKKVRLILKADDVIHSFWVPSLAGKQDLIPGRPNSLVLDAGKPGVFRGQCAEFCGLQHSHMSFFVVVDTGADFVKWQDVQRSDAPGSAAADALAGKAIFMEKPCAACHAIRGTEARGIAGPDLTHVGSRRTIGAGLLENTRGSLAAWIADPQTLKPGNNMPNVPLTSDELLRVSAYLESLK